MPKKTKAITEAIKNNLYVHIAFVGSSLFFLLAFIRDLFDINVIHKITTNENIQTDICAVIIFIVLGSRAYIFIRTDDNSMYDNLGIALNLLFAVLAGLFIIFRYALVFFFNLYT